MCTIGSAFLDNVYVFKNRDPIRGTPTDERVEVINNNQILIIRNDIGCYGGLNSLGVGIVGSFVNIAENQNNYFNGDNLIEILSCGDIESIHKFLSINHSKLYGNIVCSDGLKTYSFELDGSKADSLQVESNYIATNHFQRIAKEIRTINDPFISKWTYSRLERD